MLSIIFIITSGFSSNINFLETSYSILYGLSEYIPGKSVISLFVPLIIPVFFSIVTPGYMKDGISMVYNLELDPINSKCEWIEDGIIHIVDSKGYCGTLIQGTEAWEIYTFNLHNNLKFAVADMRRVDETYEGENQTCKVKLELDEYDNIKMSFIAGNAAPSPLYDIDGNINETAIFNRD